MIAIDLCNDCRRATGSVLPIWICCPIEYILVSVKGNPLEVVDGDLVGSGDEKDENDNKEVDSKETWVPATSIFLPSNPSNPSSPQASSPLGTYTSSSNRTRHWCPKCGTHLAYRVHPMPDEWPEMLDILLGTIDREDLELDENMIPERVVWDECALDWVKDLVVGGLKVPVHARTSVKEKVRTI